MLAVVIGAAEADDGRAVAPVASHEHVPAALAAGEDGERRRGGVDRQVPRVQEVEDPRLAVKPRQAALLGEPPAQKSAGRRAQRPRERIDLVGHLVGHAAVRAGDDVAPGREAQVGEHGQGEVLQLPVEPAPVLAADGAGEVRLERALRGEEDERRGRLAVQPPVTRGIAVRALEVLHRPEELAVEALAHALEEPIRRLVLAGRGKGPEHHAAVIHPYIVMEHVIVAELEGVLDEGLELPAQVRPGPLVERGAAVQPVVRQGHVEEREVHGEGVVAGALRFLPGAEHGRGPAGGLGPAREKVREREGRGPRRLEALDLLEHARVVAIARQGAELRERDGARRRAGTQEQPRPVARDAARLGDQRCRGQAGGGETQRGGAASGREELGDDKAGRSMPAHSLLSFTARVLPCPARLPRMRA